MDDLERALLDAESREPGPELRARVLAASRPLVAPRPGWLDRLWFSRTWRLAAAAALLAIACAEMLSPPAGVTTPLSEDESRVADSAAVTAWAARQVGLTRQQTAVIVAQALEAHRPGE